MPNQLRRILSVAAIINIVGGVVFFPYSSLARQVLGLPITSSFYLLLVSFWIFLFAGMFIWMLQRDEVNEGVLLLSALGKLSFAALVFAFVLSGKMGILMSFAALIDIVLAVLFLRYVGRPKWLAA